MMALEWTSVALAVIGLFNGAGWIFDHKKHRHEIESLRADNRQKEMNLGKDYVTEFRTFIAEPLQREVSELRQEVDQLRHAIQRIDRCPHRAVCPVLDGMQYIEESGTEDSGV